MTTYKVIISGHLEFANARSYQKVFNMYENRAEVYYKNEVLLKTEDVFFPESNAMDAPRAIGQATERCYRNTLDILKLVVQYAIMGSVTIWKFKENKLVEQEYLEPKSDKTAVQSFLKGRELIVEGKESEAHAALSRAIDKFERHSHAYERRGHVNFLLGNIEDAQYDLDKSITLNPRNAQAHLSRGLLHLFRQKPELAVIDFDHAVKNSIPHQPIYWRSRRLKGECHLELEQYDKAVFELKLFTNRTFKAEDINHPWKKKAWFDYGRALLNLKQYDEAIKAFDQALDMDSDKGNVSEDEQLVLRGLALKNAGKDGFTQDWERAATHGNQKAIKLLSELA